MVSFLSAFDIDFFVIASLYFSEKDVIVFPRKHICFKVQKGSVFAIFIIK